MCIHDLILVLYYKEFVAVCIGADSVLSCKLQRKTKTFVFVYLCGIYLQTSFFGWESGKPPLLSASPSVCNPFDQNGALFYSLFQFYKFLDVGGA